MKNTEYRKTEPTPENPLPVSPGQPETVEEFAASVLTTYGYAIGRISALSTRATVEQSEPAAGQLPPGIISYDDYIASYHQGREVTQRMRGGASQVAMAMARYAETAQREAGVAPAAVEPKVVRYVTDPTTSREHKVVSLSDIQEVLQSGYPLGELGRKGLKQVYDVHVSSGSLELHDYEAKTEALQTSPEFGRLAAGVVSWSEFLDGFVSDTPSPTTRHRVRAAIAASSLAEHARSQSRDRTADATDFPADMRIIACVTDPVTGRQHKVVSLENMKRLLDAGQPIRSIGLTAREGLRRVFERHLPDTAIAGAMRPARQKTLSELRNMFADPQHAATAIRAVEAIHRHEVAYAYRGVPTPPEQSVYEAHYSPDDLREPLVDIENLRQYLMPSHYVPGQIKDLGGAAVKEVLPVIQRHMARHRRKE